MDNNKISIVVPVYKVEEYIQECIDSILAQDYKNFELILVDDGSPDACGEICDQYKTVDSRICVIHKKNGGLSDARNAGLEVATGKYITFIDSDDFVSKDYLSTLYKVMINESSDIVQGRYTYEKREFYQKGDIRNYSSKEALRHLMLFDDVEVCAWSKLYKIELFKNIRYPFGKINEDNFTTYKLILAASKVTTTSKAIYFYRYNPSGIMNGKFNPKRFDILNLKDEMIDYFEHFDANMDFEEELDYMDMRINFRLYNFCLRIGVDKKYIKEINSMKKNILSYEINDKYCDKKYKIMIFLLRYFSPLYKYLTKRQESN